MVETARYQDVETQLRELADTAPRGAFVFETRKLSRELLSHGYTRDELLEAYELFRKELQRKGREDQEDELLDVMDQLDGWSSPRAKI